MTAFDMDAARSDILGSDFIGAFCSATERIILAPARIKPDELKIFESTLRAKPILATIGESDLIGMLCRANSNGLIMSNLATEREVEIMKENTEMNVLRLKSRLNAIGSNILANDKIAIINPDYSNDELKEIADVLGVETIKPHLTDFKTLGANNILTNSGMVVNNRCTDSEKSALEHATGFQTTRSTAATGVLSIGLAVVANSKGIVAGNTTSGFELSRIINALE
jgi:translation initiation factor 6